MSDLVLSCEDVAAFANYLSSLEFSENQVNVSLGELINIGSFAKNLDDAKETVQLLKCFELTDAERNQFICDNFGLLFNDYSRKLDELFAAICEKYGTSEGFRYLCQNPMVIRLGMQE